VQLPITIGLHRSRFLDGFILLAAVSASTAALAWPQSTVVQAVMLAAIWMLAALAWRRLSPRVTAIRLEVDGGFSVRRVDGESFAAATLLPGATVHPWLTVIRLCGGEVRFGTVIAAVDSLSNEDFRRLRIFLRWRAMFSAAGDGA
jgi:toxin CptA